MTDYETKIQAYYDLKPTRFSVLHLLTISQSLRSTGVCEQRVSMVLGKELDKDGERLYLDFDGVRNLRVHQPEWSMISISHIEIMQAQEKANVDGSYLVRDPDQESIIWFGCRDFQAIVG